MQAIGARLTLLLLVAGILTCDWITGPANQAPQAVGRIPDQIVEVDSAVVLDLAAYFADLDGDTLSYTAVPAAPATAGANVSGRMLAVTGVAAGETVVTVTAQDPDSLTAMQSFAVTVPNRVPLVADTIPDGEVFVDDTLEIDVAAYFVDPDGDDLEYGAASSDTARATVSLSGSEVSVTGMAVGAATVTVTVRDPGGLEAEQSFEVTVPNRMPVAVGTIGDRVLEVDSVTALDVTPFFADPDRDALNYVVVSSDLGRVGVVLTASEVTLTGVAKGGVTVTVTARDPGGLEARQSFGVMVPNRTPEAVSAIEDREVFVGEGVEIDVTPFFADPDGDSLEYSVVSSDTARVAVEGMGGAVTVRGVAVGTVTVSVTAGDPEGLVAEQDFEVMVPNRPPEPLGTIAALEVFVGDTAALDVAAYFTEPDGEALAYAAESSSSATAAVAVSGSSVAVAAMAVGGATVTVTARDPHGVWAEQQFVVTVPNRAPETVGGIADRVVEVDSIEVFDIAARFTEPDGEDLKYEAVSSDTSRVGVAITASTLGLTGLAAGSATVTVTARDPGGLEAVQRFVVTVPNRAPVTTGRIADQVVRAGDSAVVDLAAHFADPDGDTLVYAATSSDRTRATASVSRSALIVTGVAGGSATVRVSARDSAGLVATQSFHVTVPNQAPEAVGTIGNRSVEINRSFSLDISPYFTDPDGDALTYTATSSSTARVTVSVSGSTVTVTGNRAGIVTITVTATDPDGRSANQDFRVRVEQGNRRPRPAGTIPDASLSETNTLAVNVSQYFRDPDGDDLDYTANSSDPAVAGASVSGTVLTVVGESEGEATITATATDPGGLSTTQRFDVTVEPAPPSDLVVGAPSANPNAVGPGETFALSATVRNRGGGAASTGTTLRYYRSADRTIGTGDTEIGTDAVPRLASSQSSSQSLAVTAPSALGTYYYGACADAVDNESSADNNCSSAARVVVTESNRAPRAVGRIADHSLDVGDDASIDAAPYFTDPDGDDLSYSAASSNTGVARVTRSGGTITVAAVGGGDATITVTATDPGGLTATQRFEVEVEESNRAPFVASAIPDLNAVPGEQWVVFPLSNIFTDPDGDDLTWTTWSGNTAVADPEILGDTVFVDAVALGSTVVTVTATDPEGLFAADAFQVTVVSARFDLDLHFTDDVAEAHRTAIRNARDRWEAILADTELEDISFTPPVECREFYHPTLNLVDDHAVFVGLLRIDGRGGVIARASYCHTRQSDGTPVVSRTMFDVADIDLVYSLGDLEDVALHEFAHGLGFTDEYFEDHNLLDTVSDPHFTGALAIAAFNSAGGASYTGAKVPVTLFSHNHWRESVFGLEVMTPLMDPGATHPFSAITLQAMADLGYVVDVSLADDYQLSTTPPPDAAADTAEHVYDLSHDFERGPVMVIGTDGRVVRVIPPPRGTVLPSFPRKEVRIDPRERDRPRWVRSSSRRSPPRP